MSVLAVLPLVTVLLFAVLSAMVAQWRANAGHAVAVAGAVTALGLTVAGAWGVLADGAVSHHLGGWPPPIGIEYVLDPLSAFMSVLVMVIGLLVLVYPMRAGFGVAPRRGAPVSALALLLLGGLLGVIMAGDLFNLYVFLEIYAIASYALIALGGDRAVVATLRYLILSTIGSGFYLLGVGFLYFSTGTLNMADAAALLPQLGSSPTLTGAAVLIVVGLGIKAALFPLHIWLPDAHSTAPPGVAALLAAVQVKVGAYALIRIVFGVLPPEAIAGPVALTTVLAWFGAAGILYGSVLAVRQTDLKRLLAYSTVAQLGYIGVGIGLATPLGLVGALLHVLSHGFMKAGLFLVAGGILAQTGLRSIPAMAGLGRRMPWTMAAFALAAMSMVGVPPTVGFFSKWYLLTGSIQEQRWGLAVVIVLSSLLTAAYFLRVAERVFTGQPTEPAVAEAREPGPGILGPVWVLAAGVLVLGLANVAIVNAFLEPAAVALLP